MERDTAVDGYFLVSATTLAVVGAFYDCSGVGVRKADGAVFGVVSALPVGWR